MWLGNLKPSDLQFLSSRDFKDSGETAAFLDDLLHYLSPLTSDGGATDDEIYVHSCMLDGTGIWEKISPLHVAKRLRTINGDVRRIFLSGIEPERRVHITNALQRDALRPRQGKREIARAAQPHPKAAKKRQKFSFGFDRSAKIPMHAPETVIVKAGKRYIISGKQAAAAGIGALASGTALTSSQIETYPSNIPLTRGRKHGSRKSEALIIQDEE